MRSFYSERTAEYVLVPRFATILSALGVVAPISFLKTREGNNVSQYIHKDEVVRIVAFFARRPKVDAYEPERVLGKINSTLFEFSRRADRAGIPVFCGLPVTSSFFELADPNCLWFHVDPGYGGDEPIFYVDPTTLHVDSSDNYSAYSLAERDVLNIAERACKEMSWTEAVTVLSGLCRRAKEDFPVYQWWARNWQYKPMYFVIRAE